MTIHTYIHIVSYASLQWLRGCIIRDRRQQSSSPVDEGLVVTFDDGSDLISPVAVGVLVRCAGGNAGVAKSLPTGDELVDTIIYRLDALSCTSRSVFVLVNQPYLTVIHD